MADSWLVEVLQRVCAFLVSLFCRQSQPSALPTSLPLKARSRPDVPQTPRRQPPHEYCSLGPNQLGPWRAQKEQFMRHPSLTASPKQRRNSLARRADRQPSKLAVAPPVFKLPSLTAVDDWNARVDVNGTYQLSNLHARQPLPAVIITPSTPEKKSPPSSPFTPSPSSSSEDSSNDSATPSTPQLPKIAQPIFVQPEDDSEDIALKRVLEDLEYALVQREKEEDVNPFDLSPCTESSEPSFNISQSLQISFKQSQDCTILPDALWDVSWDTHDSKTAPPLSYATSTPLLNKRETVVFSPLPNADQDPFTSPENIVKAPRMSAPYPDLFDLDMYLEASFGITNTTDLGLDVVCSSESENPFEDAAIMSPEVPVTVPMNHLVKRDRDNYRPTGYTRSPRFSVAPNGSPIPIRPLSSTPPRVPTNTQRPMTIVDRVRSEFVDSTDNTTISFDDTKHDSDDSEVSMPALKARLREACRKSEDPIWPPLDQERRRLFCVNADPPSPHTSLALRPLLRDITNVMPTTRNPVVRFGVDDSVNSGSVYEDEASAVRPSSRLLRDVTHTVNNTRSSAPITRNPIVRFGKDIANIVVNDSANSVSVYCDNFSKSVWVEDAAQSWERVSF